MVTGTPEEISRLIKIHKAKIVASSTTGDWYSDGTEIKPKKTKKDQ